MAAVFGGVGTEVSRDFFVGLAGFSAMQGRRVVLGGADGRGERATTEYEHGAR